MDTDANQASREEKEAKLNQRMEEMRLKNAALQKRYQEVQADKRNAEDLSHKFQETRQLNPTPSPATRAPAKSRPPPAQKSTGRARFNDMIPSQPAVGQDVEKKRPQRLNEDDGPPPDPGYSFLSDRRREGGSQHQQQSEERNQGSRRHAGNYGGQNFENVRSSMQKRKAHEKGDSRQGPQNKMEMAMRMTGRERREYEQWKNERSRIEEDRVNRHKTSSGEWKREWDRDKNSTDEEPEPPHQRDSRRGGVGGYRGAGRANWPRGGHAQRADAENSPRYTSEHDHQRGEFVPRGNDFPSLLDESGGDDSAAPPNADGRKIEINSNTMKISFTPDKNDNRGGDDDREPARWRNREGRGGRQPANATRQSANARNSANTSRHSGPASSQSEDEVAAPRRGNWRTSKNEAKRAHVPPSSDWRDKKRPTGRQTASPADETSKTPYSLYGDLREVLNRVAKSSAKLPPLQPEPTSGDDEQAVVVGGATAVEDDAWEDDASWEDAASGVGSSQGFSSDLEAEGGLPSLAPPEAGGQSLGDGIRDLILKNSELLMTNMNIIDISLAGHDREAISLGSRQTEPILLAPRELEQISLAPRELEPISLAPRELEQIVLAQGDAPLEIGVFRDTEPNSENIRVEEKHVEEPVAVYGVDSGDANGPPEQTDTHDPDEVYYSDQPDQDTDGDDITIEDAESNHADITPPPAACSEMEDPELPIGQLVTEHVGVSDNVHVACHLPTETPITARSRIDWNDDSSDDQAAMCDSVEDTTVQLETTVDHVADSVEPLDSLPIPDLSSGIHTEHATVGSGAQINICQPPASHHSESSEPLLSQDDHVSTAQVTTNHTKDNRDSQPVGDIHQAQVMAEQSDADGPYELELSPSLNSTFSEDKVEESATNGEHVIGFEDDRDVKCPVGGSGESGQDDTSVMELSADDAIIEPVNENAQPNQESVTVDHQLGSDGQTSENPQLPLKELVKVDDIVGEEQQVEVDSK